MKKIITLAIVMVSILMADWHRIIGWSDLPLPPKKEVVKSDTAGVFIRTALYGFNERDTLIDDKNFQQITIPESELDRDTIRAGKPQIPYIRLLIAVPDSCGFNITLYPVYYTLFDNYLIYPIPRIVFKDSGGIISFKEVYTYDTTFYQKDTLYPNKFYEIKGDGHWRDQRVLEVFLYPVRFNPQKRLMYFYTGIDLKIEYTGKKFPNTNGLGPFEDIGREILLNYPGIDRSVPTPPPPSVHYYTDLLNPNNVADYIIVTQDEFLINETTSRWIHDFAQWRVEHNRFDVGIVKVQDIYEQFGPQGQDSAQVRNFLIYAYEHWKAYGPSDGHFTYCLFVGDWDYVPSALSYYEGWLMAYELYFALMCGDDLFPDIMFGRWPVKPNQQLVSVAKKTLNYEKYPTLGNWRRQGLLIAGDGDYMNEFDNTITAVKPYLTNIRYDTLVVRYSQVNDPGGFASKIQDNINGGAILTLYVDHGGPQTWWHNYDTSYVKSLKNNNRNPVVLANACLTGMFQWDKTGSAPSNYPPDTCIGEHFLFNPDGGAVAYWGATTYCGLYPSVIQQMLERLFVRQNWILGKFLVMSSLPGAQYPGYTCLLGDPALDFGDYTAYPDLPDLVIRPQGIDIELLAPYPYPSGGATIPIKAKVYNIGHARANNVRVNLRVSKEQTIFYTEDIVVSEIKPRDTAVVIAHWNTGQSHPNFYGEIGDCEIEVIVDPNNQIQESWEYNNRSSITKKTALYPNQPNWPKKVSANTQPAIANLDAQGGVEVIYFVCDSIYVFNADGSLFSHWPKYFKGVSGFGVGNITGDDCLEVVAVSEQFITVYDYQGNVLPGYPVEIPYYGYGYRLRGLPALGRIRGQLDGYLEIVVLIVKKEDAPPLQVAPMKVLVYDYSGQLVYEFNSSREVSNITPSGVSIAEIRCVGIDDFDEIAVTYCYDVPRVDIFNKHGLIKTLNFGNRTVLPALADLNGDSYADVIVGCSDNYIRAYDVQNDRLLWEQPTEGPINSSPAVGDIHPLHEGVEITFGNDAGWVHLREKRRGSHIYPWPYEVNPNTAVQTSPAIANINGDAYLDIIIGANNQYIYGFKYTRDSIPPFPLPLFGQPSSPIIGDIDGDGKSEIILSSSDGYLHIWKNLNSRVSQYLLEWPQFHHDYQRTGLYNWSP
ncbi:MAG: C25 family cysteine peptidase [bacterium]